jgi:hypothetical protein
MNHIVQVVEMKQYKTTKLPIKGKMKLNQTLIYGLNSNL